MLTPSDNVIAYMDAYKKWMNASEWITMPQITCEEFDVQFHQWGALVPRLASILHGENCDISRCLEVYRGSTLVFEIVPIKLWLFPTKKKQPEWFRKDV